MTGKELRDAMDKLKISATLMGRIFHVHERTVFNWIARGDEQIPQTGVSILMTMLLRGKVTYEDLDIA
jgi:hypothetical protein